MIKFVKQYFRLSEKIKLIIGGLIVAIAFCLSIYKMKNINPKNKKKYVLLTRKDIVNKKVIFGTIEPKKSVKLKTRISGELKKLYAKVGKKVRIGMPIARVVPIVPPNRMYEARTKLEIAMINSKKTFNLYKRYLDLYNKNVISKEDFENIANNWKVAKENLTAAKQNLDILEKGYVKGQNNASNIVTSTIDGVVLELPFEEGSSVMERSLNNSGSDIAIIADMNQMVFRGELDDKEVVLLKEGMEFDVTINIGDELKYPSKLIKISPKGIVKENGVIKFEIESILKIKDTNQFYLRAGYSASAEIELSSVQNVLAIDEKYIITENGVNYVKVLKNNKPKKIKIELGISDGSFVEVKKGLTEKDKILIEEDD